jgi:hypothetical protein
MTRQFLAGAAAFALMTGVAMGQGLSSASSPPTEPTTESSSSGIATSSTPPQAAASPALANPSVTNYGTGGMQALPGTSPNIGAGR